MKKLNLPIIKGKLPESKSLTMNDYVKFVYLNLQYTSLGESRKLARIQAVNVPFSLK